MPAQNGLTFYVLQAEFTHVEPPQAGVLLWVRRVVPGVQLETPKHDGLYHVAALRHLAGETKLLLQSRKKTDRETRQEGQEERTSKQVDG